MCHPDRLPRSSAAQPALPRCLQFGLQKQATTATLELEQETCHKFDLGTPARHTAAACHAPEWPTIASTDVCGGDRARSSAKGQAITVSSTFGSRRGHAQCHTIRISRNSHRKTSTTRARRKTNVSQVLSGLLQAELQVALLDGTADQYYNGLLPNRFATGWALSAAELLELQTAAATDSPVQVQLEADAVSQTLLQRFNQVQKSTNTGCRRPLDSANWP